MYVLMHLLAALTDLQVITIHIKIDTIQDNLSIRAKNIKGKHPQLQWQV